MRLLYDSTMMLMITCEFKTNGEAQNDALMEIIWQVIKDWIEFAKREVILCQWVDDEGYHVAISSEIKVIAAVTVNFDPTVKKTDNYEVVISLVDEHKEIKIPSDVSVRVYKDRIGIDENNEKAKEIQGACVQTKGGA